MVLSLVGEDSEHDYGPVKVRHHVIRDLNSMCAIDMRSLLQQPETIDVYSVLLAHDNACDGLGVQGESDWRTVLD
ncbi:hypothetical protein [Streptomyces lavendulae]|uniref:hypothetical protein n=1 Tax=Streptomyces lavendulae TaxID=1914 RepID=UPI0031EB4A93